MIEPLLILPRQPSWSSAWVFQVSMFISNPFSDALRQSRCNASTVHLASVFPLQVHHRTVFWGGVRRAFSAPDLGSLEQSVDTGQASSGEDFGVSDFVTPRNP